MNKKQMQQYQEYQRVYRNAKAKERRLKKNHNKEVNFNILTPTEWKKSRNKKREIEKLENFTDRNNQRWQFVNLGKESISATRYRRLSEENQRLLDNINYHKKKTLKRVLDLPYLVHNPATNEMIKTDQVIQERLSDLKKKSLKRDRNRSMVQKTEEQLLRYQKSLRRRLRAEQQNNYAKIQKKNYLNKLEDFSLMLKGTSYEEEYNKFMKTMRNLSPEDYEAFYYLSDMGAIDRIRYVNRAEIGTPEGQEKIYANMKAVKTSWQEVQKLLSM